MPFNEISSRSNRPSQGITKTLQISIVPHKFSADCHYCGKKGHKERECHSKKTKRDEANKQTKGNRRKHPQKMPGAKLQIGLQACGYTGRSAGDCRYRVKVASALMNVPYGKQ